MRMAPKREKEGGEDSRQKFFFIEATATISALSTKHRSNEGI